MACKASWETAGLFVFLENRITKPFKEVKMFKNPRYTTKGINENLTIITQIFLWGLIERMEVPEQDYLQVFKIHYLL